MRRISGVILLAIMLALLALAAPALGAIFHMKDGTTVEGQLSDRTIKLKTGYGEASFKVADVVSYQEGVLKLRDGNTIKGSILNRSFKVKASGGTLTIDPLKIESFEP